MTKSSALSHAGRLWEYLSSTRSRGPADAVVVCCSYDLRVCDYACELIRQGLAPRLILTGNTGNWTRHSVPPDVLDSWRALIADGFTHHLLPSRA